MMESYTKTDGICFVCGDMPSRGNYVCDQCGELCDPKTAAAACVRTACPPTSQQVTAKINRYES
jgi:hypothetical protein